MIVYLETSLFESPALALVNTVNTIGVMGKGIALAFKNLYPAMFAEYQRLCDQKALDIGKLYVYTTPNKMVVNFPTKTHWRMPSRPDYIEAGLRTFAAHYNDYGISSASFPQLGCGNGELDWLTQVQPLMEHYLHPLPIPIYIHLYSQNKDFVPERLDAAYRREVMLERRQYTFEDVWADLQHVAGVAPVNGASEPRVWVDEGYAHFAASDGRGVIDIHRDDIEEVWNTLRVRGTASASDIPRAIDDTGASASLLLLLARLNYIKPVMLRHKTARTATQGLRLAPEPETLPVTEYMFTA